MATNPYGSVQIYGAVAPATGQSLIATNSTNASWQFPTAVEWSLNSSNVSVNKATYFTYSSTYYLDNITLDSTKTYVTLPVNGVYSATFVWSFSTSPAIQVNDYIAMFASYYAVAGWTSSASYTSAANTEISISGIWKGNAGDQVKVLLNSTGSFLTFSTFSFSGALIRQTS